MIKEHLKINTYEMSYKQEQPKIEKKNFNSRENIKTVEIRNQISLIRNFDSHSKKIRADQRKGGMETSGILYEMEKEEVRKKEKQNKKTQQKQKVRIGRILQTKM